MVLSNWLHRKIEAEREKSNCPSLVNFIYCIVVNIRFVALNLCKKQWSASLPHNPQFRIHRIHRIYGITQFPYREIQNSRCRSSFGVYFSDDVLAF